MRGVSAGSQRRTVAAVEQAVDQGGADAARLGDELFAIVEVLDGQPALRRLLTDPSSTERAKSELAERLFGAKVSDPAVDVLQSAATGRWNSTLDLGDALEVAGVTAHLAGAERADELDEVEDELFRFGQQVKANAELRAAVSDRSLPFGRKSELVGALLVGRTTTAAQAIARQAAALRRRSFEATLEDFGQLVAQRRDRLVATVTSAYPLGQDERERLTEALSRHYDRDIHLNEIVDESVLGGLSVAVGAQVIDATVASRLDDARRRIAG